MTSTNSGCCNMACLTHRVDSRWREVLTSSLQLRYMSGGAYLAVAARCDNPDQRIVQDVSQFCDALAFIVRSLAATPFKVVFYACWVGRIASWQVPLIVAVFFAMGFCLQRCASLWRHENAVLRRPCCTVLFTIPKSCPQLDCPVAPL